MNDWPTVGSFWKAKDPDSLTMATPKTFMVEDVFFDTVLTPEGQVVRNPTIETSVGGFKYYIFNKDIRFYEEVTDPDEVGWFLLQNMP